MALTKKRRLVLANYISDPNCTLEAALVKAGYSERRAQITAIELRKDPEFIAAIERKQTQKLEKLERGELSDQEIIDAAVDADLWKFPGGLGAAGEMQQIVVRSRRTRAENPP